MAHENKRFRQLIAQYGFWAINQGKGGHKTITDGTRKITVSDRGWQKGNPEILDNLEKQIKRAKMGGGRNVA